MTLSENKQFIWDAHSCLPLSTQEDKTILCRHKSSGFSYVSVNVGMDYHSYDDIRRHIDAMYAFLDSHAEEYVLARTIDDIHKARELNKMAISFDLEGLGSVEDNVSKIEELYQLGVRQASLSYNRQNKLCGGCITPEVGLSKLGVEVLQLLNEQGIIVDCSHASYQASLDIIELSDYPVIFSHSNAYSIYRHQRNILDEQLVSCKEKGGVVGVNGIGIFIGNESTEVEDWFKHLDHIGTLIGWEHVGIGLDYCYSKSDLTSYILNNHELVGDIDEIKMIPPEEIENLVFRLRKRGLDESVIENVLGRNFLRIAETIWK